MKRYYEEVIEYYREQFDMGLYDSDEEDEDN
jgi:hypothetical protein